MKRRVFSKVFRNEHENNLIIGILKIVLTSLSTNEFSNRFFFLEMYRGQNTVNTYRVFIFSLQTRFRSHVYIEGLIIFLVADFFFFFNDARWESITEILKIFNNGLFAVNIDFVFLL